MTSRPVSPSNEANFANHPMRSQPSHGHSRRNSFATSETIGGASVGEHDQAPLRDSSSLTRSFGKQDDAYSFGRRDDALMQDSHSTGNAGLRRSNSQTSQSQLLMSSRGGTLKKKASLRKTGSLKRSSSKRSSHAGSVRSLSLGEKEKYGDGGEFNSAFHVPVPTSGRPTDVLATRFQAWRKVLKDLVSYFRDLQKSYDVRSKSLLTASNAINHFTIPSEFLSSGGICDATYFLRDFHRQSVGESNKAKEIENEVISQLTVLRSELQQKIKEIKGLSDDFKSSVDKEVEGSRKAVGHLQEALGLIDSDPGAVSGKGDPFIVKLAADRQIERQIEEENYLHTAYRNLETSGRELESIVVGEIQKAYTAYAGILKREADEAYETAEKLREGPLMMAKDHEWDEFVTKNDHMIDPRIPLRSVEHITYPGKYHAAATEVRSGMLERKSKYLKNYTPGWYILSPTHLHEFKSADGISSQTPVMSLYLPEQKLGSHSEMGSSSHKFMVKGRQTGGMHRGHSWVFRAESYDTMMAWYTDIQQLAEKSGKERDAFVRRSHGRSLSGGSMKAHSIGSSDGGLEEDEADAQPYASEQSIRGGSTAGMAGIYGGGDGYGDNTRAGERRYQSSDQRLDEAGWKPPQRPSPGGRFPSELKVDRDLRARHSLSGGDSSPEGDRDTAVPSDTFPGASAPFSHNLSTHQPSENTASIASEKPGTSQLLQHDQSRQPPAPSQPAFPSAPGYGQSQQQPAPSYLERSDPSTSTAPQDYTIPAIGVAAGSGAMYQNYQSSRQPTDPLSTAPAPGTYSSSSTNNNNGAEPVSSSYPDTESLSTMPTSIGSVHNDNTTFRPEATTINSSTTSAGPTAIIPQRGDSLEQDVTQATKPMAKRTPTGGTISDLHIPGEYPKTPKVAQ